MPYILAFVAVIMSIVPAWITHVVWIINKLMADAGATAGQIVLGILGTFAFPIGVIHGFILWFS